MRVEWRHVVGWKGFYEVSNDGRVRSVTRVIQTSTGARRFQGRILKPNWVDGNYPQVQLSKPGRCRRLHVHVAVARAFLGPCPAGKEVCHKDGTRTNNRVGNLRYGSRKSNAADRKIHGTNYGPPARLGENNPLARLTVSEVREIRRSSETLVELAKKYNVHFGTIHAVKTRKTWAWLEE